MKPGWKHGSLAGEETGGKGEEEEKDVAVLLLHLAGCKSAEEQCVACGLTATSPDLWLCS